MKPAPLGRREGQKLEFKAWDVVGKDLAGVAREVVAMLNAQGGEVWIGVREEGGAAVAVEPLAGTEVARQVRRLHDHLIDTVEPSPREEVEVEAASVGGGELIRITVAPRESAKPYAYVRQSNRLYVTRVGDRLRPLTRDEIAAEFRDRKSAEREREEKRHRAVDVVQREEETRRKVQGKQQLFWLRLQPVEERRLNLTGVRRAGLLTDPARSGVEGLTGSFTNAYYLGGRSPELRLGRLRVGTEEAYWLEVRSDGGLLFSAPLESFKANPIRAGERLFHPLYLLDYPVSVLRLLGAMLAADDLWEPPGSRPEEYVVHLALFGLGAWSLLPGTPGMSFYTARLPARYAQEDFALDRPLVFTANEIEKAPDRCAFRLVARVYEAFGFFEDGMPLQFDRATGRYHAEGADGRAEQEVTHGTSLPTAP